MNQKTGRAEFPNDPARAIYIAGAIRFDLNVRPRKMVRVALLVLMLEAAHTDLVSPSA